MNIKKVVVVGSRIHCIEIAFQIAYCGFDVSIWLNRTENIQKVQSDLKKFKKIYIDNLEEMKTDTAAYCKGLTSKETLTLKELDSLKEHVKNAYSNLKLITEYTDAVKDTDLIIESITENPKKKIIFYKELANHIENKTILVTNSPTLLPTMFAKYTARPEKYLSLHFASKPWMNNTVEIMGNPKTEQEYYTKIVEFAEAINMIPLKLKKAQPGQILNSILIPFLNASQALFVNDIADYETIDNIWMMSTGAPTGPFRMLDALGLEKAYSIILMDPESNNPNATSGKIAKMLKEKIDAGETGIHAKKGFYEY